jgi:hypothetical protein
MILLANYGKRAQQEVRRVVAAIGQHHAKASPTIDASPQKTAASKKLSVK